MTLLRPARLGCVLEDHMTGPTAVRETGGLRAQRPEVNRRTVCWATPVPVTWGRQDRLGRYGRPAKLSLIRPGTSAAWRPASTGPSISATALLRPQPAEAPGSAPRSWVFHGPLGRSRS